MAPPVKAGRGASQDAPVPIPVCQPHGSPQLIGINWRQVYNLLIGAIMAKPPIGAPAPSPFFSPAHDQSTVAHLKVTAQLAMDKPDGTLILSVTSGNVGFPISIANLPGRPEYKMGDRLLLEYPKGQNPMLATYSAIYHADQVPKSPQPHLNRSTPMSAIQTAQSNALIPTFQSTIGGHPALCCDARALHIYLGTSYQFTDWIKARIEKYGFEQGKDFELASKIMKQVTVVIIAPTTT